jgi:para-aminobenzoate synthetase component I
VTNTEPLQPWYWRSLPLAHRSGAEIFAALFRHQPIATLLESPWGENVEVSPHSRYSICAGSPRGASRPRQWTPTIGEILTCLRDRFQEGQRQSLIYRSNQPNHLPFIGGWLGWLGYDLAWEIETLPQLRLDPLPFPVAFWYEPENFAVLDHSAQTLWLAASAPQTLDRLEERLKYPDRQSGWNLDDNLNDDLDDNCPGNGYADASKNQCDPPIMMLSQAEFEDMVRSAKTYIQAGDIFQANLSLRFHAGGTLQPWKLYQTLQHVNPSPFASYWQTPWGCIVSCSPERLVKLRDRLAQTRPIAGTRPRGQTSAADRDFAQTLSSNPKERAEHAMLVDLGRNDLGRVCQWGTVRVDEFLSIETYSHVMHLVSNVVGQLHPDADPVDLIKAVFPGGTITGCPKVRCMELIEQLEPVRRSLFYGSCGFLDARGSLDLNILIRTLLITAPPGQTNRWHHELPQPAEVWGQVGAGIVADSDPTQEWLESLQKAQAQWVALQKLTTPA